MSYLIYVSLNLVRIIDLPGIMVFSPSELQNFNYGYIRYRKHFIFVKNMGKY